METAESKPIIIMRKYIRHIVRTFVRYIYLSHSKIVQSSLDTTMSYTAVTLSQSVFGGWKDGRFWYKNERENGVPVDGQSYVPRLNLSVCHDGWYLFYDWICICLFISIKSGFCISHDVACLWWYHHKVLINTSSGVPLCRKRQAVCL